MKTREIQDLIDFISKSGLNEVNIETEELKLKIKRDANITHVVESPALKAVPAVGNTTPPAAIPQPAANNVSAAQPATEVPSNNYIEVKSPMIGTFYSSANPESDPFINVGDSISSGQTVCVIEAMKLFNEIESEVTGKVVRLLVEDATPVEYDQPLFLVDPN